tara:strand:+ start:19 stop:579 length:561 start_codon:yes stop_codon:yes gene_type:complete
MNKWVQTILVAIPMTLFAYNAHAFGETDEGYYAGFMLGPTSNGGSGGSDSGSKTSYASRFLVGYEKNSFLSYEAGLAFYPQATSGSTGCSASNQKQLYLDVVLKGTMPVSETIGIFAKAGVATTIYIPGLNSCQEGTAAKFYPTVSTGGSFGLSEGLFFDISWNRLGVRGDLSYIDLYALGFSYHF